MYRAVRAHGKAAVAFDWPSPLLFFFAEGHLSTRQRLRCVPEKGPTAKVALPDGVCCSPCVAHGKDCIRVFAVCQRHTANEWNPVVVVLGSCPCLATGGKKVSHQYTKHGQQMMFSDSSISACKLLHNTCSFLTLYNASLFKGKQVPLIVRLL